MADDSAVSPEMPLSVVILAGGHSKRLGRDKSLLELEGQPLLARVVQRLGTLSDDLVVVTNDAPRYESLSLAARFVPDEKPGMGSLMGIYSGVQVARHSHALVVACDMPFLSVPLLRYMASLAPGYDVVVPRLGAFLEPLHAIYGNSCLPFMKELLDRGERRIVAFFHSVRVRYVKDSELDRFDPEHLSFVNVNTPQDWVRAQELLGLGTASSRSPSV
jgi:molybdopterin-guanine dinucleotide biosynthesis protein A